ncbi:pyridoxal phosphate-dependent decarboxylase family protein [Cobetia marina]|jgi:L-2,4-diaminobutyrate decarboxylase|uniref:pyridoxal phosphate-dependent decarboxylase family protein n=1 Tax=Cobetia marina TaxID=28258 RepID=UPI0025492EEC|nr:aspartate aminotransferase family protein [Cobetia pacifica]MDI6003300.1 aspartate aminotransferase family protein [Cobetia pacifica]
MHSLHDSAATYGAAAGSPASAPQAAAAASSLSRSPSAALFSPANMDAWQAGMQRISSLVAEQLENVQQPFSGITPEALRPAFAELDLETPLENLEAGLEELQSLYLKDAVYFHHPRYIAHLNCPVVLPGVWAESLLGAINSSLDTWDQSAGGTLIEQRLIDWTTERLGLGPTADGIFTSGGTQSNLMALLLARDAVCEKLPNHPGNQTHGLPPEAGRLRVFASGISHFSLQKACALLGLGHNAVIPVAVDERRRMDPIALREALDKARAEGLIPMAVVGTAGTTDFGSIDPLQAIGRECHARGIWFHVDGAYGGGLITSRRHGHWLKGVEMADSVTIDYHKTFFQPVSCSACVVRDRTQLRHVTYHADYLNPELQAREGTPDQVNKSLQTTRRFDALKLWLTLRLMGADALGDMLDCVIDLTREGHQLLAAAPDIDVVQAPELSTLVFRFHDANEDTLSDAQWDALNREIRKRLSRSGEAIVAATKVSGRQYLKFTLLNPDTTRDDIAAVVELIRQHGQALVKAHHLAVSTTAQAGHGAPLADIPAASRRSHTTEAKESRHA